MTARTYTPAGFLVTFGGNHQPSAGLRVRVNPASPLDRLFAGEVGQLLGYTVAHGFAVVQIGTSEALVHPESLEVL